jgi:hypothetical protein
MHLQNSYRLAALRLQKHQSGILLSRLNLLRSSANDKKTETTMCVVCFEHAANTVILQCGHCVLCQYCAVSMKDLKCTCPICRQIIVKLVSIKPDQISADKDLTSYRKYVKKLAERDASHADSWPVPLPAPPPLRKRSVSINQTNTMC